MESAISPGIIRVGKSLHRLAENLSKNSAAQALERTPPQCVEVEVRRARCMDERSWGRGHTRMVRLDTDSAKMCVVVWGCSDQSDLNPEGLRLNGSKFVNCCCEGCGRQLVPGESWRAGKLVG